MYERIQSIVYSQKEYKKSKSSSNKENTATMGFARTTTPKSSLLAPLGIQSLAASQGGPATILEAKSRSLSNQLQAVAQQRRISFEQILHLSTNEDSSNDDRSPKAQEATTLSKAQNQNDDKDPDNGVEENREEELPRKPTVNFFQPVTMGRIGDTMPDLTLGLGSLVAEDSERHGISD